MIGLQLAAKVDSRDGVIREAPKQAQFSFITLPPGGHGDFTPGLQ